MISSTALGRAKNAAKGRDTENRRKTEEISHCTLGLVIYAEGRKAKYDLMK
jgi:hypothetical protein